MPGPIRNRRTGTASAFNPNNYGSGTLRADFDVTKLALADGAAVVTWPDSSGNGNDAGGGTSPVFKVGVQNGKPGVLFTAASTQYLIANGLAGLQNGTDLPFTVIIVVRHNTHTLQTRFSWGSSTDANPLTQLTIGGFILQRRSTAGTSLTVSTGITEDTTSAHVVTSRFDGTTGTIFRDGAQAPGSGAINSGAQAVDRFALGALLRATPNNPLDGYLFRVLVYASALSTSDRVALERGLGQNWRIVVA